MSDTMWLRVSILLCIGITQTQSENNFNCWDMSSISAAQLSCVFPTLGSPGAANVVGNAFDMNSALKTSLTTTCDWAAFLGNVGGETDGFSTQPVCDSTTGAPYCPRGPLQISGEPDYEYCSQQAICNCADIVTTPDGVATSGTMGYGTAACLWQRGKLNQYVSTGTAAGFKSTACVLNGEDATCTDPQQWTSRLKYWKTATACVNPDGVPTTTGIPQSHQSTSVTTITTDSTKTFTTMTTQAQTTTIPSGTTNSGEDEYNEVLGDSNSNNNNNEQASHMSAGDDVGIAIAVALCIILGVVVALYIKNGGDNKSSQHEQLVVKYTENDA